MASLEYVTAGWLRSRRLTVASVGAGRGCGGLCPRPVPRQGGGLGLGDFLQVGGRLGRRGGGKPWLHSGRSSLVYLVSLWALFSSVRGQMGWALVSCRVWPSGLSGALLPWSSSFWRCQTTRICGPPLSPKSRRRYSIVPSHQIQSPVWSLRKGCWTFAPFSKPGYASGWGGAGGGREDDEDAWSGRGGGNDGREDDEDDGSGFAGWVGWRAGGREVAAFPAWLGADAPLFCLARLGGTGVSRGWGGVGFEEGVRCLLARIPQWGFCRRLHVRFRLAAHEVGELAHGLWGVGWPWQCGRAVIEGVVKVVVPHCLGLHDPGLRGFRCVWAIGGALSPVECCVEGFPWSAFAACQGGGLQESLPALLGIFRVYLRGIGLGRHEDSVCPVEDPPFDVRFQDVDGGLLGGCVQGVPRCDG